MKAVITGREGYLARSLSKWLPMEVVETSLDKNDNYYLDLNSPESFNYDVIQENDVVFHLAAISSPEKCEYEYSESYNINVVGSREFINSCLRNGARVVFISSDTVYGNDDSKIFNEKSECNPIGNYGKMKYETEKAFMENQNVKIFRLSYIFSKYDKFTRYLAECMDNSKLAEVYHPFYRNIVYINDFLDSCKTVALHWENCTEKIYNICGRDSVSRVDMAELFSEFHKRKLQYTIIHPGEDFFKIRPEIIKVESLNIAKLLGRDQFPIVDAFESEYIKE